MFLQFVSVTNSYTNGSAFGSTAVNILDISVIIQFLFPLKLSSVSQLINNKSNGLQKLRNYFKQKTTSVFNLVALSHSWKYVSFSKRSNKKQIRSRLITKKLKFEVKIVKKGFSQWKDHCFLI